MTYYINPIWFYLMNVSSGAKIFLLLLGGISLVVSAFACVTYAVDGCMDITDLEDGEKKILKIFKKIIIASTIVVYRYSCSVKRSLH